MSLDILFKYFDKDLPVIQLNQSSNSKSFVLFEHSVTINVYLSLPTVPNAISSQTDSMTGLYITIEVEPKDLIDVGVEFFICEESLRTVKSLISDRRFEYLCFNSEHNTKIVTAIAQRLTKLKPNIEHITTFYPFILIY